MAESKPVAIWARVAAGAILATSVAAVLGVGWRYWHGRGLPDWPWYEWLAIAFSGWTILPLFLCVALKGDVSWRKATPSGTRFGKFKATLNVACSVALFVVGYRYERIATVSFAILLAVITLFTGLQIYLMPVKAKLAAIAKTKARHGIPLDQPHHIDKILKSGYFRIS